MEKLGIDFKLIAVQIVNFGLLLFILNNVLYKKVLQTISDRQKKLEEIEKRSVSLTKKEAEIEQNRISVSKRSARESQELLENARRQAEADRKRIIDKANKEARDLIKNTQKQIERENKKMISDYQTRLRKEALALVEGILKQVLDSSLQKKTIDSAIKKLSKV